MLRLLLQDKEKDYENDTENSQLWLLLLPARDKPTRGLTIPIATVSILLPRLGGMQICLNSPIFRPCLPRPHLFIIGGARALFSARNRGTKSCSNANATTRLNSRRTRASSWQLARGTNDPAQTQPAADRQFQGEAAAHLHPARAGLGARGTSS